MKKKLSELCIALGVILLVMAVLLTLYNETESAHSEKEKDNVLVQMQEEIRDREERQQTGPTVTEKLEFDPEETSASVMAEVEIDGYSYIGTLEFPALEVQFPIMSSWDETRLKISPCRYFGSYLTDDLVIAGHNYRRGFGKLKQLQVSDTVIFTDVNGDFHYYLVDLIEVLQATDIQGMTDSPWELSLYTCTYDGQQRLTIRCKKQ